MPLFGPMPLPPLITNAVLPFNMPVITSPCSDAWISQHTVRIMTTEAPLIPVSWGELADKVSILEIKCARLRAPGAVANAARELAALTAMLAPVAKTIPVERSDLTAVATRLWEIENAIREKEAARDFGDAFVALGSVYHENDERGRIKAATNRVLRSDWWKRRNIHGINRPWTHPISPRTSTASGLASPMRRLPLGASRTP